MINYVGFFFFVLVVTNLLLFLLGLIDQNPMENSIQGGISMLMALVSTYVFYGHNKKSESIFSEELSVQDTQVSTQTAYAQQGFMNCPKCGEETLPENKFCGGCGADIISVGISAEVELPRVQFLDAVQRGFKRYFDFTGRATKAEYWWVMLFMLPIWSLALGFDYLLGTTDMFAGLGLLGFLLELATFFPLSALAARRLHDINKSGWWQLLWLPLSFIIVGLVVIVIWLVKKGDKGPNKYGPDPRTSPS